MNILYGPDEHPPFTRSLLYSLQWLAFNLVNVAVVPLVAGSALGLDQAGISELARRTMFFASLASILQALVGHRLPIIEGPAGMWWAVFISLATIAPGMGKDLSVLRTDLELGVVLAGVVLVIIGLTGLMGRALKFFTPAVTGTVLVLLTLQLSGTFLRGMLGITDQGGSINPKAVAVSLLVITVVVLVNLKGRGFVRSIAILIGTVLGWIFAVLLGLSPGPTISTGSLLEFPVLFAWGSPTFDPGIVTVSILTGILVLSNEVASILAMERTLEIKVTPRSYSRGVAFTGIADILAGSGATLGVVPYSASAGLVSITGVGSRTPFILFAILMMVMGLLPPVGAFLSSVPAAVGYAVLLTSFCQMLGFGLKDYTQLELNARQYFVIGLPIIIGTGILNLPSSVFNSLPVILRYIAGNGFIAGMVICLLLEHVFLREKYFQRD